MIPFMETAFKGVLFAIAILVVAQTWGVNLTGIVAGLGLAGLAVSLAAKEVLDDVLGFMVILADDVFRTEEYIITPKGQGIVEQIGLRSTRIRALDQSLIVIPNQALTSDAVTNWSRLEKRWFNFMIGVTYQTSIEQLEQVVDGIREMLKGREAVDPDSVVVLFTEYGGSALNILIRSYIKIADWTEAQAERHAVNLEIKRICAELDVSIAYETQSLFIENMQPEWFAGAHLSSQNGGTGAAADANSDADEAEAGEVPDKPYPGGDDDQVDDKEGAKE
jgi:MscS family membrane protein